MKSVCRGNSWEKHQSIKGKLSKYQHNEEEKQIEFVGTEAGISLKCI